MGNLCGIVSAEKSAGVAVPGAELIHCRLDMSAVLMRISFNHYQRLVSGDALDCRQINASLHEVGYRCVAQRVAHDYGGIESSDVEYKYVPVRRSY